MNGTGNRYLFGPDNELEARIARSLKDRRRAWRLVYDVYRREGYAKPREDGMWHGEHDALPETTTFLAERNGAVVATLTILFDGPLDLPCETIYGEEVRSLRSRNRRLCEIVSLAHAERSRTMNALILAHLFRLAYVTARHMEGATDFVVTVNPHHVPYYRRVLLFEELAGERTYEKVSGAPAVLLRLDLEKAPVRYRRRYEGRAGARNLYRWFCTGGIAELSAWLQSQRRPLDAALEPIAAVSTP